MAAPTPAQTPASIDLRAVLAIGVVTVLWGWTFVWMKQAVAESDRVLGPGGLVAGVGLFMSLRFGLACLVLPCVPAVRRGLDRGAWGGGLVIGSVLLGGFLLQMFGLQGVSPAVSAFLTSLYVVFTALFSAALARRAVPLWLAVGVVLATLGAGFIGGPPQLTFGLSEWLTVGCAFLFAIHILVTDRITKRSDPMAVTWTSMLFVTLGSLATLLVGLGLEGGPDGAALVELATSGAFLAPMVLASLFATVLALSLMNLFQRRLDPVRAAILYAIEPVWASTIAIALGLAVADRWLWIGGSALFAGNLLAELGPVLGRRARRPART